ncbi:hypothetical protein [Elioraea tepidiphila]|uniref:hypothetical protein n=1 Tax=Elioraea tepidiphila TaxID=457934 RepID=UPI002FDB78C4
MSRLDVLSPRKGKNDKTYWLKVGAAFPRDAGGYSLTLDALPLPDAEGQVRLLLAEPRQDGAQGASGAPGAQAPAGGSVTAFPGARRASGGTRGAPLDDDIPFAPEVR